MKRIILVVIAVLAMVLGGCQKEKETIKPTAKAETKKDIPKTKKELSEQEMKQILKENLNQISGVFKMSAEENNWGIDNPAAYEIVAPEFKPYVTERFSRTILEPLIPNYYCECDAGYLPYINTEVKFKAFTVNENKFKVSAIEPATEISNMAYLWRFTLVKEKNQWKMDKWDQKPLKGINLKLTKSEAEKLLTNEFENAQFYQEYKDKTGATIYIMKMTGEDYERLAAISSKTTELIYDFEAETRASGSEKSSRETISQFNFYEDYQNGLHLGYTKEQLITEFGEPSSIKETASDVKLTYDDASYTVSNVSNTVYEVEIQEDKADNFYSDFEEISKAYNFDDVYAMYDEQKTEDENGYHLKYETYNVIHIFTSSNEDGSPIKSIFVSDVSFK
jgi:hypothetical protein